MIDTRMRTTLTTALFAASIAATTTNGNAQAYPVKPIRFIVPFSAGGGADIVARALAQKLGDALAQQVVIDNRTGAAAIIGTELAAKSAPDGYTLILGQTGPNSINPGLYEKLPYDALRDFAPITLATTYPYVLVVHPSIPTKTVTELIALAKARPNELSFASAGNGAANHLAAELFKSMASIQMVHVPYKASAPALIDVLGGHVSMMFDPIITAMPQAKLGKLRALGVTTLKRAKVAPDVPAINEAGVAGFQVENWQGIVVPAKTPRAIVDRLNREIIKVLAQPAMIDVLNAQGLDPAGNTPAQFDALIRTEIDKWRKLVQAVGIRVD